MAIVTRKICGRLTKTFLPRLHFTGICVANGKISSPVFVSEDLCIVCCNVFIKVDIY